MLKLWKQTWKKGETHNEGTDGDTSDQQGAGLTSDTWPSQLAGSVRSTPQGIIDSNEERPSKRIRRQESSDALSMTHMPETKDIEMYDSESEIPSEVVAVGKPLRFPDLRPQSIVPGEGDDVLKCRNTILVVDSEHKKFVSLCKILTLACSNARKSNWTRKRFVLLVVEDLEDGSLYASKILESLELPIGIYTPILHSSSVNQWVEMAKNDVVVSPATLLLESLVKGSLAVSQVDTLVLSDILAVRDNNSHPITKVMQSFYHLTEELTRPKVYGVFSVPQGVQFAYDHSMLELEHALDAKISNIEDEQREEVASLSEKPTELVVFYKPQVRIQETPLMKNLRRLDKRGIVCRTQLRNARNVLSELGACACDLVWRRSLKDLESEIEKSSPVFEEEDELQEGSSAAITKIKTNIRDLIKNWLFTMPNLDASSRGFNVTPKFARLIEILKACEPHGDAFRGIIFVQKRSIAYVISDLIRKLDDHVGFLRPQTLTGHDAPSNSSTQSEIMDGFKSGLYNLLIVTKYAEDLDLFPATTVIRFDIFDSEVSYAHCRARAKGRECHLIHMAERGSDVHRRLLSQISEMEPEMERWVQSVARRTSAIPPRPLKETVDPYRSDSEDEDEDPTKFMKDPTTSGRIYLQDATTVVYRFASQIQKEHSDNLELKKKMEPLFEYETFNDGSLTATYICTVLLPRGSPLERISGPPCNSIAQARRTACHQTCIELFQRGMLDYRLFPRPSLFTERPQRVTYISSMMEEELSDREEDEASLPVKAKQGNSKAGGTRNYPRKKPDFWPNTLPIMRGCLYPTIVAPISTNDASDHEYAPILLLTRLPLPTLPSFKVFLPETTRTVHFFTGAALHVDEDQLQALTGYTLRLLRMVINRPFVCPLEKMAYFFAPLSKTRVSDFEEYFNDNDRPQWSFVDVGNFIPWDQVKLAAERSAVALNTQDLHTLIEDTRDAVIQDRWTEFTRRYYCVRMRPDLTPLSKPDDSPREKDYKNLLEYCKARRLGFVGLQNDSQPMIEVESCNPVANHLNPLIKPSDDSKRASAKYLIPELCAKCTTPASIYRTAFLLPSVMRRLDDLLLVKELNARFFDHSVREDLLHQAISATSAGMEFNYERLELLGDAYLKYLSSIYLFVTFPTQHEGALHVSRQRIISNRSLLRNANRCNLPQYIQSRSLLIKAWAPPNFEVHNNTNSINAEDEINDKVTDMPGISASAEKLGSESATLQVDRAPKEALPDSPGGKTTGTANQASDSGKTRRGRPSKRKRQSTQGEDQGLGDKTVADVAEAIIGAAYISGGREVALKVTKALNVPLPHVDRWDDFGRKALAPPPEITAKLRDGSIEAVEAIIGHKFKRPHLLAQALTHASIHGNAMTTYERLEFIGDAILDFLVIRHIYDRYEEHSPGALTLLKGAMVSNSALAAVCVWAGLHEHLLFESVTLADNIRHYANVLRSHQRVEYTLATQEGRPPGQYWVDVEPPKALSDVVESIMGAVYVSDGFSSVGAETFFNKIIKPFFDQHITLESISHHPTKVLLESLQSMGCVDFKIERVDISPDADGHTAESIVLVHDVILARATDKSSTNAAARMASSLALDAIQGDPGFLLRTCDCLAKNRANKTAKKHEKTTTRNLDELEEQFVEGALN